MTSDSLVVCSKQQGQLHWNILQGQIQGIFCEFVDLLWNDKFILVCSSQIYGEMAYQEP